MQAAERVVLGQPGQAAITALPQVYQRGRENTKQRKPSVG